MKVHHVLLGANLIDKPITVKIDGEPVKLQPKTGVFRFRAEGQVEWVQVIATLSGYLLSRISERKEWDKLPANVEYIGHEFVTYKYSKEYADSPFKLIKFIPTKGSDVPVNYRLECVDEKALGEFDTDLNETFWKTIRVKASQFTRKQEIKFSKMLEDLKIEPVDPQFKRVPVKA